MNNRLIAIEWSQGKTLHITWQTSDVCNHRCSYCNPGNWSGNHPNNDAKLYLSNLRRILDHYQDLGYHKVKLFLSGGEPTTWQPLEEVISTLHDWLPGALTVAVNTNLSRPVSWWQSRYQWFDDVVASYHPEWVKHERFIQTASYLQTRINYLAVRMLMLESHWDMMVQRSGEIYDALHNVHLEHVPILDELSPGAPPYRYSDPSHEQWLREHAFMVKSTAPRPRNRVGDTTTMEVYADGHKQRINSNRLATQRLNRFNGWICDVGCSINISTSGAITAATCGQGAHLGWIHGAVDLAEVSESVTCASAHCQCGTDICIPKRSQV